MMVSKDDIRDLARQIGREFNPERVILFGSYAHGSPTEGSDVDLLVIMAHEGRNSERALEIVHRLQPRIPVDLLVRTPHEIEQRLAWNDYFLKEVTERGEVLYESSHP